MHDGSQDADSIRSDNRFQVFTSSTKDIFHHVGLSKQTLTNCTSVLTLTIQSTEEHRSGRHNDGVEQ